jgi:hypothetical protein
VVQVADRSDGDNAAAYGTTSTSARSSAAGIRAAEIQAAPCYTHDVLIEDPFDEEQVLSEFAASVAEVMPDTTIRFAPDPEPFVDTIRDIAPLARVAPRRISLDGRLAGKFASNAWDMGSAPSEEVEASELANRSLRLWLASGGRVVPLFVSDAEEQAFAA